MGCCLQQGYVAAEKMTLMRRLAEAGISLPEGAQIWGPGQGMAWRLVDRRGNPPTDGPVGGRATIKATAAAETLTIREERGARLVHPTHG